MAHAERRLGWGIFLVAILVVIGAGGALLVQHARALHYTVAFDDAQGLRPGDRVVLSGVDIGQVTSVQLNDRPAGVAIGVRIDPEHAGMVHADSTGMIRGVTLPNVSGQKVLEIFNPETQSPPLPMVSGARVEGLNGLVDLEVWRLRHSLGGSRAHLLEGLGHVGEQMSAVESQIRNLAASPEVQKALDDLRRFLDEMQQKGRVALAQLQIEWTQLQAELQPLIDDLQTKHRDAILKTLHDLIDQVTGTLQTWQAQPSPTPGPQAQPSVI